MIFASEGDITLGYKIWHYPANCSFTGTIKDKNLIQALLIAH